ncbi:hypothetical protein H4R26_000769 [Coemansia thaxteri]|uniref:Uncharacterized protein n=1 Tax=Coemansia thaxteri TaxID=2663907 RepID=A0A9W8BNA9_9FUNG|nr:hypothetical protein H4R26_000769 [Coemansia thaxteri]
MASSITLTGSRSALARPRQNAPRGNQAQSRLARELAVARIDEEPEEDEGGQTGMTAEAELRNHIQTRSSQRRIFYSDQGLRARHARSGGEPTSSLDGSAELEGSLAQSRRQKAVSSVKRKARHLLHLLSYYLGEFLHNLGTTSVTYRPLQLGIY